ncbi:MAG: hypothetical protein KF890_03075 [Nitrospira sp.]|nr:hypothetical protein [Nitrospira sp.]
MIAQFINHHDVRWKEFLKRTKHDFYALPEYVELTAIEEDAMPIAFYAEHRSSACLIPLLVRPIPAELNAPPEWYDCISPYGYPGILLSSSHGELLLFLDVFRHLARERGIVTAFIRLHPLLPLPHGPLEKFGRVIQHGPTVYVNLSDSKANIWQQVSTNHQRDINRLMRLGFHCTRDDWSRFPEFVAMYHANMKRVSAREQYFFSPEYFEGLRTKLGNRVHLVSSLTSANELAAAGLMIITDGIAQHHLLATAEQYLRRSPSKLVVDGMWRWAQEQSCDAFHVGGGVGAREDSLFHFKAGFSPLRSQFCSYRVVIDDEKYRVLNRAARQWASDRESEDFFPGYRYLVKENGSGFDSLEVA